MDLIWLACLRAALAGMKPKRRLRYLQAVSDIIGDPDIVPCAHRDAVREIVGARETWAKLLPKIVGAPVMRQSDHARPRQLDRAVR